VTTPERSTGRRILRVPHVYTIIFVLLVLLAVLGLWIPAGQYARDAAGRVMDGTFSYTPDAARPAGLGLVFAVLKAPLRGIEAAAPIVAFIFVIGGAFKVFENSGAFDAAIRRTVHSLGGRRILLIPVSMLLFSIAGAVFGMSEEIIPFVMIYVPLMRALGYPPLVGVAIPLVGAGMGFAGAMINPFTVGIAQAISGLPPLSGWGYRTVAWVVLTVFGIAFVTIHARRNQTAAADEGEIAVGQTEFTKTHAAVLAILAGGIGVMLFGIQRYEWYVTEIGAVFLAMGLCAGAASRQRPSQISIGFLDGAKDLLSAALVVGFARGIVVLSEQTYILDTILYASSVQLARLPAVVALGGMFGFQSLLNMLVPSGSGQAALTMPILAPLSDLCGLNRQLAVLAFQFGDGFTNLITPTSAVLMGSLEAGKIPYGAWFRFAWPMQVMLVVLGLSLLGIALWIGYGG